MEEPTNDEPTRRTRVPRNGKAARRGPPAARGARPPSPATTPAPGWPQALCGLLGGWNRPVRLPRLRPAWARVMSALRAWRWRLGYYQLSVRDVITLGVAAALGLLLASALFGCAATVEPGDPGLAPYPVQLAAAHVVRTGGCHSVELGDGWQVTAAHCRGPVAEDSAILLDVGRPGAAGLAWALPPEVGDPAWTYATGCRESPGEPYWRHARVAWVAGGRFGLRMWPGPGCRGDSGGGIFAEDGSLLGVISGWDFSQPDYVGTVGVRP